MSKKIIIFLSSPSSFSFFSAAASKTHQSKKKKNISKTKQSTVYRHKYCKFATGKLEEGEYHYHFQLFYIDQQTKSTGPHHKVLCSVIPNRYHSRCFPAAGYVLISNQSSPFLPPLPPPQPVLHLS